jgi:branched-chain amino acid transport system substrate-binding protein
MKIEALDSYSCQVYDHVESHALALASGSVGRCQRHRGAGQRARYLAGPQGEKSSTTLPTALKLLSKRSRINYDGASGHSSFADNGDVKGVFFRYEQISEGQDGSDLKVA